MNHMEEGSENKNIIKSEDIKIKEEAEVEVKTKGDRDDKKKDIKVEIEELNIDAIKGKISDDKNTKS